MWNETKMYDPYTEKQKSAETFLEVDQMLDLLGKT